MKVIELIEKIKEKGLDKEINAEHIRHAYEFADKAHLGQLRKSGEPYINHPFATAYKLIDMNMDETTVIAGILHDVPEDTQITLEDVKKEFGEEVAHLVAGVTKLGQVKYRGIERYMENLRRMFIAMAKDIRVIVIKFADRIHNLETLSSLPPNKQRRIAMESLEIYSPIANRLGMGEIKGNLEDLSFPYIYPEEYKWIQEKVIPFRRARQKILEAAIVDIKFILDDHQIDYISIHGRAKHIYSLYNKLLQHNRDFAKIYDLVAIRIIVPTISNCYECLGMIHQHCKPLKGRIKDYIAQPKPNGYQSLHTTIFTKQGEIMEIQIRTQKMHYEAEYGIAAHWSYKEKTDLKDKIAWVNELSKVMQEAPTESEEKFLESLKLEVFQNRIFVFTPRGDVIELPEDATPVDFAYHIHTEIGDTCTGAKINDKIASLDTALKSGDVIEIHTDKKRKGPSSEWLSSVKTESARHHIKDYVKKNKTGLFNKLFGKTITD